ncbi:MAG: hypothetical protein ACREPM_02045 [Gemmatimonadaceae bacterium]
MSLRTFVDSSRREWLAFDVVPRADERRYTDRRGDDQPEFGVEERRDSDRRLTVGGVSAMQGAEGWLCFECGDDRRRLSPIPMGWSRASDATLESYCRSATPARASRPVERVE